MLILTEWALGLLYLLGAVSILCGATLAGCLLVPTWRGRTAWDFILNIAVRMAIGLGIFSSLVVVLGWNSSISARNVLLTWIIASVCGLLWLHTQRQWGRITSNLILAYRLLRRRIRQSTFVTRVTVVLIVFVLFGISMNILVGGLMPDFGHDSMWYHLSVPGQWAISGQCLVMPYVFPSNYPLALESITAGILTFSNEILACALNACITMMLLLTIIGAAGKYCPRHALLPIAALFVPVMAKAFAIAPIGVKNDRMAAWVTLLAFVKGYEIFIFRSRRAGYLNAIGAGYLAALAVASKVLTIAYIGPFMVVFALQYLLRRKPPVMKFCLLIVCLYAGVFIAYTPWLARCMQYTGDPLFPFAPGELRPMANPFQVSYAAIESVNDMHDLETVEDVKTIIQASLAIFHGAFINNDTAMSLFFVTIILGLFLAPRRLHWQVLLLLWFCWVPLLVKGYMNVARYFAICYPMSFLLFGYIIHRICGRFRPRFRALFLITILAAASFNYIVTQWKIAGFETVQGTFHPMVTRASFERMASHAEKGSPLVYEKIRDHIPEDATVLVVDNTYPYYLKRRAVWADEVVHKLNPSPLPWKNHSERDVYQGEYRDYLWYLPPISEYLQKNRIEYVIFSHEPEEVMQDLIEANILRRIPVDLESKDSDWSLWGVYWELNL